MAMAAISSFLRVWPVLATAGALKQVDKIRSQAEVRRTEQNSELKDLAEHINGVTVVFQCQGW